MHHQDFTGGDPPGPGSRKSSFHYRRGSSSGAPAAMDDNPGPASGSSSPGLHHQQPPSQAAGSQLKKKSGFQITSVTSAQINVSGNNSLADDTESYDDMDESHTEDLSSSDILDVSVSRATDTGQPERSSSDETLNSLHGVDTPGLVSPNEPLHPQGSVQGMVNGMVHPPHYPQQQGHHHSDSLGGGEPSLPVVPIGSSSPAMVQRQPMLDNTKPLAPVVGGGMVTDLQGNVAVAALPPSAPAGFDNSTVSGQAGGPGPPAAAAPTPNPQTQAAPGSRFRVVKLDTNSEPFRKGRWTCTEYYEKEVPHSTPAEVVPKSGGADVATAETESAGNPGNIVQAPPHPAVQPPHTLQPYPPQQNQDFTSPQGAQTQSPPQGLAQPTPLAYASPQDVAAAGGAHLHKPVALLPTLTPQPPPTIPQQLPYAVEGGYPAPQLQAAGMAMGSVRQPDFIQPTAPFQTQVQQPPLPHNVPTGVPMISGQGVPATQPLVGMQLVNQAQVAPPPAQATFAGQPQPPSSAPVHYPYMPLTAALQPLLNPGGAAFPQAHGGMRSSHLEDAQRLLLQHQGLLVLPRLGAAAGGEGAVEAGGPAGTLAHMGMSAEASAFMAAAAGLRAHAEGEEDSSSGASVVAIDNKIEQAMDLVKSHLMYAVREEVEVLKEQIKELMERNTQLEQENNLLKNLASPEQMAQFQAQVQTGGSPTGTQPALPPLPGANTATQQALPSTQQSSTQQSA